MKEYLKYLQKENILTQELSSITQRLELPAINSYKPQDFQDLKLRLCDLRDLVENPVNIDKIKTKIHDFEGKLSQMKLNICSKLAEISLEEVNLTLQVEKLVEIVKNHEKSAENVYYVPLRKEFQPKNSKEEEDYLDFVRKHGQTGGWDPINHSTFLNLRGKYGVVDLEYFYKICVDRIPGILLSDLEKHEEWFRTYSKLVQNRKKKIQEWKTQKKIEAEKLIKDLEMDENDGQKKIGNPKKQVQKREEIRQALQEWKNSKNFEKKEVKSENHKLDTDKLREIEKRKKIKEKVKEYVDRKSQIQALEGELKAVSHELVKREKECRFAIENEKFKKKDHDFLEKRNQRLHQKESEQLKREKRLQSLISKVAIKVEKDPKRLMQPTISQQLKLATIDDECEKVKSKFEAPLIPKRQIPAWRREL